MWEASEKKMCSVSFNKVAPLVRKQAFFLKCPEHPPFPIESRHFLHFSFPRNSLVVSLTGMPTLKELISTLSQVGWKLPRSLSADFILVSSEKNINQPNKQKTSQQQQHEQEKKKKPSESTQPPHDFIRQVSLHCEMGVFVSLNSSRNCLLCSRIVA